MHKEGEKKKSKGEESHRGGSTYSYFNLSIIIIPSFFLFLLLLHLLLCGGSVPHFNGLYALEKLALHCYEFMHGSTNLMEDYGHLLPFPFFSKSGTYRIFPLDSSDAQHESFQYRADSGLAK